ncbi:unnamed protein product [marine sediment metagenome]|uniref:Uncharacterized protein n=1 Tax=marine sediment metagenome TaxID=412755 RepID=X1S0Q8_9ZZZZ
MVKFYFTLPKGIVPANIGEPLTEGYTLEWYSERLGWIDVLDLMEDGVVVIGATNGSFLIDEFSFFRAKFFKAGTYETTVEVWIFADGEKDELLCSKDITATVIPGLPPM